MNIDVYIVIGKIKIVCYKKENGIQHYKNISFFYKTEHDWHRQLHHDWMKRKYARKNNIKLLIIKEINDINKILKELL